MHNSFRQEFLPRDRIEPISLKRSRGSWGGRAEWDNEPGQIQDRQLPDRMLDRQLPDRVPERLLSDRMQERLLPDRIPDRQISDRERDMRDIEWDRGLNGRSRGMGREEPYFSANNGSGGSLSSGPVQRSRGSDDHDNSAQRWPSHLNREGLVKSNHLIIKLSL